jgi:hypothetical protein
MSIFSLPQSYRSPVVETQGIFSICQHSFSDTISLLQEKVNKVISNQSCVPYKSSYIQGFIICITFNKCISSDCSLISLSLLSVSANLLALHCTLANKTVKLYQIVVGKLLLTLWLSLSSGPEMSNNRSHICFLLCNISPTWMHDLSRLKLQKEILTNSIQE